MTSHYADEIGELKESQNAHFNPSDYEEKISVEPDIGDQRQSVFKALPSRPTTPKRVMHRFRFSAVFAFVSAIVAFSLKLVLLLAGQEPGTLEGDYIFAINASRLGQDIIRFERATATSAAPSAISSTTRPSNPLDPLNPLSTSNPLNPSNPNNPFNQLTDSIIGNITDTINSGTQNAINQVVAALVNRAGVQPQYLLFVENICEGNTTVEKCSSYDDKQAGLNVLTRDIPSSIIIGQTNVSVPLIAKLSHSFSSLSSGISTIRKAIFAFLVMSLVVTGLSAITSLLGVFFPHSRVIIYFNILYPLLASVSHLLTAIILTVLIVGITKVVGGFGEAVGVFVKQGGRALLFVWLGWLFATLPLIYWSVIWFVEIRTWSFVRRVRTEEQVGNWKGAHKEVWMDLKGKMDI